MKNSMQDLHNHLFARLEALGDEDLEGEKLAEEVTRSKASRDIADKIIENARLALDADKHLAEYDRENAGTVIAGVLPAAGGNGRK